MDNEQFERFIKLHEEYITCIKNFTSTISLVVSDLARQVSRIDENLAELSELCVKRAEYDNKIMGTLEEKAKVLLASVKTMQARLDNLENMYSKIDVEYNPDFKGY